MSTPVFDQEEYLVRRTKLINQLPSDSIVILPASEVKNFSNDKNFRYRQNSDFMYFTGFPEDQSIAIISQNQLTLFVQASDPKVEQWHGRHIGIEGAKSKYFADEAYSIDLLENYLENDLNQETNIYYLAGHHLHFDILISKYINFEEVANLRKAIDVCRLIKSSYEQDIIRLGAKITEEAHIRAIRESEPNMAEYAIEAIYMATYHRHGGIMPQHAAIVAGGDNALYLHHTASDKIITDNELVLVDSGVEYKGYTLDVARTWPISGYFTSAQRKIYEIVLKASSECIDMAGPGIKYWDIHFHAVKILMQGLSELEILFFDDIQTFITEERYKRFFPHGIGHFLGMDTHDTSTIDRKIVELKPGMFITIEPGLYIPTDNDIPEDYRGIGIRIEDNIIITQDGIDLVSGQIPKEINEIERLAQTGLK